MNINKYVMGYINTINIPSTFELATFCPNNNKTTLLIFGHPLLSTQLHKKNASYYTPEKRIILFNGLTPTKKRSKKNTK